MQRLVILLSGIIVWGAVGGLAQEATVNGGGDRLLRRSAAEATASAIDRRSAAANDPLRRMQTRAMQEGYATWGHWGTHANRYSTWVNHSNRLVPVYTFGITLDSWRQRGSVYADPARLTTLYGHLPEGTLDRTATYHDQTDIYHLQMTAIEAGYRNIILVIFDGMDWQTTRAAALYRRQHRSYVSGRGTGLSFQDDRRTMTDFALVCTSPWASGAKFDVDAQQVMDGTAEPSGGYDPIRGGEAPWWERSAQDYLLGLDRQRPHAVTDSASSGTSLVTGVKTYNGAVNYAVDGSQLVPIARRLQAQRDFKVGIVTNVPVSHATPAAAYANNVTRKDYQDISRDLIGLRSSSHRNDPLAGVDVLIGGGWGERAEAAKSQGENFMTGNPYLHESDLAQVDVNNGGPYVVVQRESGSPGRQRLMSAAQRAAQQNHRLLGFFGVDGGHLPFQTADGRYNPTVDVKGTESYTPADIQQNPTLGEMTRAALTVLQRSANGFWLMVEAGDVDWANHANNLDNSIGAVFSGEEAFNVVMDWVDENDAWSSTAVIVTSDHGHYLVLDDPDAIDKAGEQAGRQAVEG